MLKYTKFVSILSILILNDYVYGKPQGVQEAALLALAQVKDTFDNGAAIKDTKEFNFLGSKMKNNMEFGFGDAIRAKRSNEDLHSEKSLEFTRNKRSIDDSSSSSSFETEDLERRKRSANFTGNIINSEENLRSKRAADDKHSISEEDIDEKDKNIDDQYGNDDYYDYSSSSSSSSSSEEDENVQ